MSLAAQLDAEYGWKTTPALNETQLAVLLLSAQELRAFADDQVNGAGLIWMRRWLSGTKFHLGGLPHQIATWFSHHKMTVVFPRRDVWLSPEFTTLPNPRSHIVHELAHVLDNMQSGRSLPATVFGGGPADRLVLEMGGQPKGPRYANGVSGIPPVNQWSVHAGGGYGNHATSEYFAEALSWSVYYPPHLPSPSITNWLKVNVFLMGM